MADGKIPISAVLTSASVHDSQVAIPLATLSTQRVTYCYELMDSAYDANHIHEQSRSMGHVPIIDPHTRRSQELPFQPSGTVGLSPAQQQRYRERTMMERVNARLKDEFGGRTIRVRGHAKIMTHLMFGILALTADQLLRLVALQNPPKKKSTRKELPDFEVSFASGSRDLPTFASIPSTTSTS